MSEREPAQAVLLIDDARVRVTRFEFEPQAETGWHIHGLDYVIFTVTDCSMRLEEPSGTSREVFVAKGESYSRDAGVEHNVINAGDKPMMFIEVELK